MPRAPFVVFNRPRFHSSPKWHSAVSLQSASRSVPTPCTLPSAGEVGVRARRKKSPPRNGKYCYLTHLQRCLRSETKWLTRGMSPRAPLTLFRCLRTPFSKCFPNAPPQRLLSFADRCVRRGSRLIRLRALHGRKGRSVESNAGTFFSAAAASWPQNTGCHGARSPARRVSR